MMKAPTADPGADQPSLWAIIPVKTLDESKRRLARILTAGERRLLMLSLLRQTLAVLRATPSVSRILVISSDAAVLRYTRQVGGIGYDEGTAAGLNTAVTRAVRFASESGADAALILPADLPFIQVSDVESMTTSPRQFFICSDTIDDGTNGLLLPLPTTFRFFYGPGSFHNHCQEAIRLGLPIQIVRPPGLRFDLDREDDWHKYQLALNNENLAINA